MRLSSGSGPIPAPVVSRPLPIPLQTEPEAIPEPVSCWGDELLDKPLEKKKKEKEIALHLGFLFSSPLLLISQDSRATRALESLECEREYDKIVSFLTSANRNVKCGKWVATLENLALCLNEAPLVVHFTGHGIVEKDYSGTTPRVDYHLLFEDTEGAAFEVSKGSVAQILRGYPRLPDLVFVSACHSEHVGKIFLEAGVPHVICVRLMSTIIDEVAVRFAETFYRMLFSSGLSVCVAYDKSIEIVRSHFCRDPVLEAEVSKIKLLVNQSTLTGVHSCEEFPAAERGHVENLAEKRSGYQSVPTGNSLFLGRNLDLYRLLHEIAMNRLVTLAGFPGMGKSSVAIRLAHFVSERGVFPAGVLYLSLRRIITIETMLCHLLAMIREGHSNSYVSPTERRDLLVKLLRTPQSDCLLILDEAEETVARCPGFSRFVADLLLDVPKAKLVLVSQFGLTSLHSVPHFKEKVFTLRSLDPSASVTLLELLAPRNVTSEEVVELLKADPGVAVPTNSDDLRKALEGHRLVKLMAGHPHVISIVASLLSGRSLLKLYQALNENWGKEQKIMNPLCRVLHFSLKVLAGKDPKSVTFLKFMGLFQSPVRAETLEKIWGNDCTSHLENLTELSLLEQVPDLPVSETRYFLLPFLADFVLSYVPDDISALHQRYCAFQADELEGLMKAQLSPQQNSQSPFAIPQDMDQNALSLLFGMEKGPHRDSLIGGTWEESPSATAEKAGMPIGTKQNVQRPSMQAVEEFANHINAIASSCRRQRFRKPHPCSRLAESGAAGKSPRRGELSVSKANYSRFLLAYAGCLVLAGRSQEALDVIKKCESKIPKDDMLANANLRKITGAALCPIETEGAKVAFIEAQKTFNLLGSRTGAAGCCTGLAETYLREVSIRSHIK